jgi:hypothetical protein
MKYLALTAGLLLSGCLLFDPQLNQQISDINGRIGQHYWPTRTLPVCDRPRPDSNLCVDHTDGFVVTGAGSDGKIAYFQVKADNGGAGYIKYTFNDALSIEDPVAKRKNEEAERAERQRADAECKRRGQPRTGMSLAQVRATCWGEPNHVNRTEGITAIHDQLVHNNDRYIYMTNGIVTSIQSSGTLR